jgi:hypothetical protein
VPYVHSYQFNDGSALSLSSRDDTLTLTLPLPPLPFDRCSVSGDFTQVLSKERSQDFVVLKGTDDWLFLGLRYDDPPVQVLRRERVGFEDFCDIVADLLGYALSSGYLDTVKETLYKTWCDCLRNRKVELW